MTRRRIEVTEIACTLTPDDVPARLEEWRAVLAHVIRRTATAEGMRLDFDDGVGAEQLSLLAAREQQCCAFFDLRVEEADGRVTLDVRAPSEARAVVDELFGA